jgi:hypothetical protein
MMVRILEVLCLLLIVEVRSPQNEKHGSRGAPIVRSRKTADFLTAAFRAAAT